MNIFIFCPYCRLVIEAGYKNRDLKYIGKTRMGAQRAILFIQVRSMSLSQWKVDAVQACLYLQIDPSQRIADTVVLILPQLSQIMNREGRQVRINHRDAFVDITCFW